MHINTEHWIPIDAVSHPAWQPTSTDEKKLLEGAAPGSYILKKPTNSWADITVYFVNNNGSLGASYLDVHTRDVGAPRKWYIHGKGINNNVHTTLFEEALKANGELKSPVSCEEKVRLEQVEATLQIERQIAESLIQEIKEEMLNGKMYGSSPSYQGYPKFPPSHDILNRMKQYFESQGCEFIGGLTFVSVSFKNECSEHKGEFYLACRERVRETKLTEIREKMLKTKLPGWPEDFEIGYHQEDIEWFQTKLKGFAYYVNPTLHTGSHPLHPKGSITLVVRR